MTQENFQENDAVVNDVEDNFEVLHPEEVISFCQDNRDDWEMFKLPFTFQAYEVVDGIIKVLLDARSELKRRKKLFSEGLEGEVLRFGAKGWQKGKIRVKFSLEFCPDEPEESEESESSQTENEAEMSNDNNLEYLEPEAPPLDDLRQKFNQENQ